MKALTVSDRQYTQALAKCRRRKGPGLMGGIGTKPLTEQELAYIKERKRHKEAQAIIQRTMQQIRQEKAATMVEYGTLLHKKIEKAVKERQGKPDATDHQGNLVEHKTIATLTRFEQRQAKRKS